MLRMGAGFFEMVQQQGSLVGIEAVEEAYQRLGYGMGLLADLLDVLINGLTDLRGVHVAVLQALNEGLQVVCVCLSGAMHLVHQGFVEGFQLLILIFIQLKIFDQLVDGVAGTVVHVEETERTMAVSTGQGRPAPEHQAQGDGQTEGADRFA